MTAPNILLVFPDQHRGDWLGFRGTTGVATPNIDALAARGVAFENALTPSPLCSPARSCLALARRYDRQPVPNNQQDVPDDAATIYRDLSEHGYDVLACGKFDLLKHSMDWGADGLHGQGDMSRIRRLGFTGGVDSAGKHDCVTANRRGRVEPYATFLEERGLLQTHLDDFDGRRPGRTTYTNVEPTALPDDAYCDNWIGARAAALIETAQSPWFLQVNFNGPHEPLDVTESMRAAFADVDFDQPVDNDQYSANLHVDMRRNYAAMIHNIDAWLGRFLDLIKRRGEQETTLVIYASDHGDCLGDHNRWQKHVPERGSWNVPLVVAGPGVVTGNTVATPVDLVDVARTVLDFGGIAPNRPLDGGSLRPALEGGTLGWEARTGGLASWRAIFDGRYKYIHNYGRTRTIGDIMTATWEPGRDAPGVLYDLENDPGECEDLSRVDPGRMAEYRDRLLDSIDSNPEH